MNRKSKGTNAEREIIRMFWEKGWAAIRVAGSGSMHYPSCDVLAGNKIRKLAIECKAIDGERKYFCKDEIEQLKTFSSTFGAEPWIAIKFNRQRWHFIMLEDLRETSNGYSASLEELKAKGLLFEELIGEFNTN